MKNIYYPLLVLILLTNNSLSQQKISPLVGSYDEYKLLKDKSSYNMSWVSLGPVLNSARVESIQVDETKPGTMYVAFGSGNLWKTINNGMSWKPIFNDIPSIGIGDIAIAPSNKDIIYVGTGESLKKGRNFTMPGTGIYKSIDGGESWNHLGLNDSWHIGEISINPNNPDIVFVSVMGHFWSKNKNRGVFRTIDGGKNWEKVLYI
ncbi:MAG: glycosyl hydrolase, partial [Rhodothermaeota bacterium MED-G16]